MNKATSRKVDIQAEAAEEGQRIRLIRERRKMTAEEFADLIEVSRGYLSELENGKRRASRKLLQRVLRLESSDVSALDVLLMPEFHKVDMPTSPEGASKPLDAPSVRLSFVAQPGKQVSKYVGADAFRSSPVGGPLNSGETLNHPPESEADQEATRPQLVDVATLELVISTVVDMLHERQLRLPGPKLAQLVLLIVEHLGEVTRSEQVKQTTERYLRLVA